MQALMFHRGVFLGTGTVRDYSFMTLNKAASTNDTVVSTTRTVETSVPRVPAPSQACVTSGRVTAW
jgi:hypothetical protein